MAFMPLINKRTIVTAALAAIVTSFVFGAIVLLVRGEDNSPIQVVLPTPESSGASTVTQPDAASEANREDDLMVYVSGAVRNPGVYRLQPENRLSDAVSAAGGATSDADLDAVNLARRVKDEEHYHIPRVGETPPSGTSQDGELSQQSGPVIDATCGGLIDLNLASVSQLDTLPGIGPVRANDIVVHRETNGSFVSVEEITEVSGIGPATLEKIRDLVTVCDGQ